MRSKLETLQPRTQLELIFWGRTGVGGGGGGQGGGGGGNPGYGVGNLVAL